MADRWLVSWALGSVALGAASLLVPLYFVAVGGTVIMLGVLAGVAAGAGAPGALLVGRLADRTGKQRVFVLGALVAVGAALALLPLVTDPWQVVLVNGVIWFAAGAVAPVLTMLVTVGHPENEWTDRFALLNAYGGWGWAGGLVVGTVWTAVGTPLLGTLPTQRSLLAASSVCAGGAVLLGARSLPPDPGQFEVPRPARIARAMTRARRVPTRGATFPVGPARVFWLTRSLHPKRMLRRLTPTLSVYYAAVIAAFAGFGVFWGPLPLYLTDQGYGGTAVFGFYLLSAVGAALFFSFAGRLAGRLDSSALQAAGLAGRAVCHPAVALAGLVLPATRLGLAANGVLFVLIGVAWAVVAVTATAIVTRLAPASIRGEALGVYTALTGVASGLGSVLGGWLGARGFVLAYFVAGALVLLGGAVVAFLWWRGRAGVLVDSAPV